MTSKLEVLKRNVNEINHCKKSKVVIEGPALVTINGIDDVVLVVEGASLIETIHDWGRRRQHWVRYDDGTTLVERSLDTLSWLGGDSIMSKDDYGTEKFKESLVHEIH